MSGCKPSKSPRRPKPDYEHRGLIVIAHANLAARSETTVKRLTLIACILGSGIALLDSTIVNVALPTIQDELGGGLAAQQWVVNAYFLALASLILVGGSLGDHFGPRRVFAIGVAGFGVASVACALAPSIEALVVARGVQGAAGALLVPCALGLIFRTFPGAEVGGAIGSWTAWSASAAIIGPLAGGALIEIAAWQWIFLVNVPFVIVCVALVLITATTEEASPTGTRRVDVLGGLLCAAGIGGIAFGLIEQPRLGWSSTAVAVPLVVGALLFATFLWWERHAPKPMLPLAFFRRRNFAAANLETFVVYAGMGALFFFLALYLQQIGGFTPLEGGLAYLPAMLVVFGVSRRTGTLAARYGARYFMGGGPLIAACGLLLLQRTDVSVDYFADVLPGLLVFSLGLALAVAPLTTTAIGAGIEQPAVASGVNTAVARLASLIAIAGVGAVVAGSFASTLDDNLAGTALGPAARAEVSQAKRLPLGRPDVRGLPNAQAASLTAAADDASLDSFHLALLIAAALVATGGIVGFAGIRTPRAQPSTDVSQTDEPAPAPAPAVQQGEA